MRIHTHTPWRTAATAISFAALALVIGCAQNAYTPDSAPHRDEAHDSGNTGATTTRITQDYRSGTITEESLAGGGSDGTDSKSNSSTADEPARVETWKRSSLAANMARVMIGDKEELEMRGVEARVLVEGFRARVVLDYYFFNPSDARQTEGNFQLRLPPGATPHYFAFGETVFTGDWQDAARAEISTGADGFSERTMHDVRSKSWSQPKAARVAPRDTAAFAYTQTVVRRVDPALLEWQGAGVFSGRVFPLAPSRLHRIVLAYDMNLIPAGNEYELQVPLPEKSPVCAASVMLADRAGIAPALVEPAAVPETIENFTLYQWGTDDLKSRHVRVRLNCPQPILLAGHDANVGDFFAADIVADFPAVRANAPAAAENAVFLLDTSLSANPDHFNVWVALLQNILAANEGTLRHFNLLIFNIETAWWKSGTMVENTAENRAAVANFVNGLALEGATDLGAAVAAVANAAPWLVPEGARADVFLLSDAAATWGDDDLHAIAKPFAGLPLRVMAYNTGMTGTDSRALDALARATGGAVITVVGEAQIEAAATAHRKAGFQLREISMPGAKDVVVAGRPRTVVPGSRLLVTGRIDANTLGDTAVVRVALTDLAGNEFAMDWPVAVMHDSLLAPRTYGQVAVGEMEMIPALADVAATYAQHFRIPGATCSLVMLESEADYQRFDVRQQDLSTAVSLREASAVLATHANDNLETLGDEKARFARLVEKLKTAPGMKWRPDPTFEAFAAALSSADFAVPQAPLSAAASRFAREIPGDFAKKLAAREIDYDVISKEAKRRHDQGDGDGALKALSSLIENNPGDAVLGRDVAYSALAFDRPTQAFFLFRRVLMARPWEPQTYHAMGQALVAAGKPELATLLFDIGLTAQFTNGDLAHFRAIIAVDYFRHLQAVLRGSSASDKFRKYCEHRLPEIRRMVGMESADLLVMIHWNTAGTDMDLHVTEPGGEVCFYNHTRTEQGAFITRDITGGYGPEMYVLPSAKKGGEYRISVDYFNGTWNRESARTKVYVTIIENFGTPAETEIRKAVTLVRIEHDITVATVKLRR